MATQFEAKLESLETVVNALEKGDLPLETALATFEEGIKLVKACQTTLSTAEQRIEQLVDKAGTVTAEPFANDTDEASDS